ncbi:MAG: cytochrome c biogenesis protein CcsA [Magnetococcales bacterium]|nr:cytochrome c biogenesis protein CcsA [Magnetococcales bacterium]MBF0321551.1 cytochrome c biogenesis protein CcsA [Magnetococcales bacterium]
MWSTSPWPRGVLAGWSRSEAIVLKFLARIQPWVGWTALLLLVAGLFLVFHAPPDFQQGLSVRIMYIHVPSAQMALFLYLFLSGASLLFLWKRFSTADVLAEAAAPVGAAFSLVTLATGSIWGKPMWGAWWAWDARLTSMLVLLIIYVGVMAMRHALDEPAKGAKATAILTLIGAVDLPIIHFSVVWWRTLHQPSSFEGKLKPAIAGPLLTPLIVMAVAGLAVAAYLVILKSGNVAAQRQLDILESEGDDHG